MSDSVWATILGTAKLFGKDADYALYDISYANALLYSRAMPMPGDGDADNDSDSPAFDERLDACDPDNFPNDEDVIV